MLIQELADRDALDKRAPPRQGRSRSSATSWRTRDATKIFVTLPMRKRSARTSSNSPVARSREPARCLHFYPPARGPPPPPPEHRSRQPPQADPESLAPLRASLTTATKRAPEATSSRPSTDSSPRRGETGDARLGQSCGMTPDWGRSHSSVRLTNSTISARPGEYPSVVSTTIEGAEMEIRSNAANDSSSESRSRISACAARPGSAAARRLAILVRAAATSTVQWTTRSCTRSDSGSRPPATTGSGRRLLRRQSLRLSPSPAGRRRTSRKRAPSVGRLPQDGNHRARHEPFPP